MYTIDGDYRFTSEYISLREGDIAYIDPSTWCIHGHYVPYEKHIKAESNVTAHLAQVHPFTLGWIADLHSTNEVPEVTKKLVDILALYRPTLTVLGGDLVNGTGVYGFYKGERMISEIESEWFRTLWYYVRNRLPNNLWIKGNHDVDPGCYSFHEWFERLWSLVIGRFKLIGFDSYNEQTVIPGQSTPYLSLPDMIWLRRRLIEDGSKKVILAHHSFCEWYPYSPEVFKDAVDLICLFTGHTHTIGAKKVSISWGRHEVIDYNNGTASPESRLHLATLSTFWKDGTVTPTLVGGSPSVSEEGEELRICSSSTYDWNGEETETVVPMRIVRRIHNTYLNLILLCPSKEEVYVQIKKKDTNVELITNADMYVVGKDIITTDNVTLYDSWKCSCGSVWNSYYVKPEQRVEFHLPISG